MPALFGTFGNIFIPLHCFSAEVGYAKLNNGSIVVYTTTLLFIACAYAVEFCAGLGWTVYPPLSTASTTLVCYGITLLVLALFIMGISTTFTSVNYIATISCRAFSIRLFELGAMVHAYVITSILLVIALPALALCLLLIASDL
jgi:cytochrome c oxidase subunit 1